MQYLLDFLRDKRGKQQVDLLGDALQQFFQTGEAYRRDQENLNDLNNVMLSWSEKSRRP